ncbi:MAG: alpha-amylase family glycosyl hydrolase, partial [Dongiaceae bacterium]
MTIRATIRLQFHSAFTLDDAAGIVPYLSALGISHIYASPLFVARKGSTHGYDVVDPTAINPELGGSDALARLSAALKSHGMGLILDIVPNHMAASSENPWWMNVLESGKASRYAYFFDINWRPADPLLRNKILLPLLGGDLAACLDRDEIKLDFDPERQGFVFRYFEQRIPLSLPSYTDILSHLGPGFQELAGAFNQIPAGTDRKARESTEIDKLRDRLAGQIRKDKGDFAEGLAAINAPGREGPAFLQRLLNQQHYILAPWQEAASRLNWRRFFDINELVALQMDRAEVFEATHRLVLALYRDGVIDGVRLDHVDGLADPRSYCRKLRRELKRAGRDRPASEREPYIIVEKILEQTEKMPGDWQIDGTTGYDFMSEVAAVLHDGKSADALSVFWSGATTRQSDFPTLVRQARKEILELLFSQQLDNLVHLFVADDRGGEKAVSTAS